MKSITNKLYTALFEGVSYTFENNVFKFMFNYQDDLYDDIIDFSNISVYESKVFEHTYYYGYSFNDDIDAKVRTAFIAQLKRISESNTISDNDRSKFIDNAISKLNVAANISTVSALLYPAESKRNRLTIEIVKQLVASNRLESVKQFPLIKELPTNVEFDFERFKRDYIDASFDSNNNPKYNTKTEKALISYVNDVLMKKIHNADYFSIASLVKKTKYRSFIKNYLKFENKESEQLFNSIENGHILIIDDINTSFATIEEIIRIAKQFNNNIKISIFTLLGKTKYK